MATITPYYSKKDNRLYSFNIKVSNGRGKKPSRITYPEHGNIPETWSFKKAKKEAERFAAAYEEKCHNKQVSSDKRIFSEYAEHVMQLKETMQGLKKKTMFTYRQFLPVINNEIGGLQLQKIEPEHLNKFYMKLKTVGSGYVKERAVSKTDIKKWLKENNLSQDAFSSLAGVGHSTIGAAANGKQITVENAAKIAAAMGRSTKDCFQIVKGERKGLSAKSVLEYHRLINTILETAVMEKKIVYNPAQRIKTLKQPKHEAEYFEIEEVQNILKAAETEPTKWKAALYLLIFTGMRRGELAGLRWNCVDWKNGTLLLKENRVYTPATGVISTTLKTGESRTVKVSDALLATLRQWRVEQASFLNKVGATPSGYILTRDNGAPVHPDSISEWLRRFSNRHDLPAIHAHKFRHTQASMLISQGVDILTVSKRLGHSKTSTTMDIYAHCLAKADEIACAALDDALFTKRA